MLNNFDYETTEKISLIREKIDDLSVLYNYTKLTELILVGCDISENDLLNFDFTKFKHLKTLKLKNNCPNKYSYIYYKKKVIEKLNEELKLNNLTEACMLYDVNLLSYYCDKYLEKNYSLYKMIMTLDEIKSKFEEIKDIIFNCEKELYDEDILKIKSIPINKSIFNCNFETITLDSYKIKEFFKDLPDNCALINSFLK
jgi:hypothetical protein